MWTPRGVSVFRHGPGHCARYGFNSGGFIISFIDYSQLGEDRLIFNILSRISARQQLAPTYVDIGGCFPVIGSNTYRLYQAGWRGIIVDISEEKLSAWKTQRPEDLTINRVVIPTDRQEAYVECRSSHKDDPREAVISDNPGQRLISRGTDNNYLCKAIKFDELISLCLEKLGPISFLNMDIEGLETPIINSSRFEFPPIALMCIEIFEHPDYAFNRVAFYIDAPPVTKLREAGYELVSIVGPTLFFSHRTFWVPFA